jgi:hypothetical protein
MSIKSIEEFLTNNNLTGTRLDLDEKAVGCTGYIDSIVSSNFPSGIHYGLDPHGRAFVTVKIKTVYHNEEDKDYNTTEMITCFQRYSDNPNLWVMNRLGGGDSMAKILELLRDEVLSGKTRDEKYSPFHFETA